MKVGVISMPYVTLKEISFRYQYSCYVIQMNRESNWLTAFLISIRNISHYDCFSDLYQLKESWENQDFYPHNKNSIIRRVVVIQTNFRNNFPCIWSVCIINNNTCASTIAIIGNYTYLHVVLNKKQFLISFSAFGELNFPMNFNQA